MGPTISAVTRVVLDTNVLVSALLFEGVAHRLVGLWKQHTIMPLISKALLAEYIRVLHYPKFHLAPEDVRLLLEEEVLPYLVAVKVRKVPTIIREDPPDNQVLACARFGRAHVILSGDHHLLTLKHYQDIPIQTPGEFLRAYS
jgi:putative PIN family toxin of toxin-antitoxin system